MGPSSGVKQISDNNSQLHNKHITICITKSSFNCLAAVFVNYELRKDIFVLLLCMCVYYIGRVTFKDIYNVLINAVL